MAIYLQPSTNRHLHFGSLETSITTPKGFQITLGTEDKKVQVAIKGDHVDFSSPLTPTYVYWYPAEKPTTANIKPYWTKKYIGTDASFYQTGYRWGISLGNSPETFKKSTLYRPGGGINLADGRYVIAFKANQAGLLDVVIGKEDRGIDQRLLTEFKAGKQPDTNAHNEILGVSNHSMLVSRGQPYDANTSNPDDFSAYFAGEIDVVNHHINYINDQSGQFFGPYGLTKPLDVTLTVHPDNQVMKQPDYENIKSKALLYAKETLEKITNQSDIHMVKVVFENNTLPKEKLTEPRETWVKPNRAHKLKEYLNEKRIQEILDQFDVDPKAQLRLIKALAKNGESRVAIFDLTNDLKERGTLKPEQASKLALELFEEPNAIGMFLPESPLFLNGVSDNTKRKLVATFNKLGLAKEMKFSELIQKLKGKHPLLIHFLIGKRVAAGFFKETLNHLGQMTESTQQLMALTKPSCKEDIGLYHQPVKDALFLYRIDQAEKRLDEIERTLQKKGNPEDLEVVLLTNPFEEMNPSKKGRNLAKNLNQLRKLHRKGVNIYRLTGTAPNRSITYLINLYAMAHKSKSASHEMDHQLMDTLMKSYGVDVDGLYSFAREKFQARWSNDLILATYARTDKAFGQFMEDLAWFRDLPSTKL